MNFSRDTFANQLSGYTGISVTKSNDSPAWLPLNNTTGALNTYLSYSKGGFGYRTWSPETSTMPTDLGLLVSCKIDVENGIGDDHIVLMVGFLKVDGQAPQINFVQASVQFHGDDALNIMSAPITSDPSAPIDLGQAMYDSINSQIIADNLGTDDTSQARKTMPDIARANINSMIGAVTA